MEVAFASRRPYVSLYVLRAAVLDACADPLAGLSRGAGCVRFRRLDQIPPAPVRAVLDATVARVGPLC